jgi:NodT family efflux transporter outer membrane factor (OMF) lipoprotein
MKIIALSGALILLLTGCAQNVPGYNDAVADAKSSTNLPKVPAHYSNAANTASVRDNWIKSFHDSKLNRLVLEAQKNNPNLRIAAAKVERAVALTQLSESELKPIINLAGYYHDKNDEGLSEVAFGGASISWEPDVWGRVQNMVLSQKELTQAQAADYNYARQSLAATTAKAWFMLNADSKIYDFSKEIVKIQKKGLKILTAREEIGQGTKRDVHLSRALVASAQDSAQAALSSKERSQRALEVLLGRYPAGKIKSGSLDKAPPRIPTGMPAQLLERRPDLIAAEARVAAAFHQKESAKLLHMPNIRLKLGVGPNTINDAISSISAGVLAPLYTGGAIEAQIAAATADQKAAIALYAQTALRAFQEVENALSAENHLKTRLLYVETMVKEYKTAYKMTVEKYRIGESTVLDILIIQGKWIAAEIKRLQIVKRRLINRINLHLALGGSFDAK